MKAVFSWKFSPAKPVERAHLRKAPQATKVVISRLFLHDLVGNLLSAENRHIMDPWQFRIESKVDTLKDHSGSVETVVFSPDGQTVASGSWDNTIKLWDVRTGGEHHTLKGHSGSVRTVVFSPDGQTVALGVGTNNEYIRIRCEYSQFAFVSAGISHRECD